MISFYRRIRKRLMKQNLLDRQASKITQYLAYAFGEVFLVVVGILIALGINNWNEGRKEKKVELEILTNIKTALVQDTVKLNLLNQNISNRENFYDEYRNARKTIGQPNAPRAVRFGQLSLEIRHSASTDPYKSLESRGFSLIKDKDVREAILRLYNTTYPDLQSRLENFNQNLHDFRRPLIRKYFKVQVDPTLFVPDNYEEVMNSKEILNELSIMKLNLVNNRRVLNEEVLPDVTSLLQLVGNYIDSH